jgi:hypothetical protein
VEELEFALFDGTKWNSGSFMSVIGEQKASF